ncbi:MAG: helix-turn-helix domain-containing protein [Clostridia bacterium]|nr:helix-turn-helix domain-containing protein [Clostridia bacterium]
MPGEQIYHFGTEKYAYENTHAEYEGTFCIEKMGITYPDKRYMIGRENEERNFYRRIYVLEYVISGEGYIECDHEVYKVQAGDFYLLSNSHLHRYYCNPENPYTKIWINVGGRIMNEMMQLYNLQSGVVIKQMNCHKIFEQVFEECSRITEETKAEVYRKVFKLIVRLLDQLTGDSVCDILAPSSYKIRDYIDSNIQTAICLDDIAKKFFFSKSYIISCFKNEFGIPPKQYILQKKIETAKSMLLETDMSIRAIAEMLHFADSHHFSNTFKKQTGLAPVEFRMKAG